MPVYKRGNTWWVDLTLDGRRSRVSAGRGISKGQAQEYEAQLRRDWHAGRVGRKQRRTLSEALARWLNGEARALAGWRNIASKIAAWAPHTKGRGLEEASDVAGEAAAAWRKAGLSPYTINGRLRLYRRAMKLAATSWGWLDRPPTIELVPGERPRMTRLDEHQARRFLAACGDDQELLDAIILQVHAGLRPGEVKLPGLRHASPHRLELDASTKTGRPRSLPLTREAARAARRLPITMGRDALRYRFERARERAGMPWLQMRDLRRTFGSWIVQRTGSLKAAQDLLGQSSSQVTARHYAHLLDEHLEAAVGALPRLGKTQRRHSRPAADRRKRAK